MGILDQYRQQVELDKQHENDDFPEGSLLTENDREEYQKRVQELRNSQNSIENQYKAKMSEMRQMSEADMEAAQLVTTEDNIHVYVKHAFCEECGEELISNAPPLFNPFTFERVCKHTCEKCGKIYNLEFAYPRAVFCNADGKEITTFMR